MKSPRTPVLPNAALESYRIELGISPLSDHEAEKTLAAVRNAWKNPAWIKRQRCSSAWLLVIQHECPSRPDENPVWLTEKLAAAIWHAVGRYVRITFDLKTSQQEESMPRTLDEQDYRRILRDFRFSRPNSQR